MLTTNRKANPGGICICYVSVLLRLFIVTTIFVEVRTFTPVSCNSFRLFSSFNSHRPHHHIAVCRYSNHNETFTATEHPTVDASRAKRWTLSEDWALTDGVRAYTIGGPEKNDGRYYTFWERMVRMIPELRSRTAADALKRYHAISMQSNATSATRWPVAGPSPPLLHDWWLQVDPNKRNKVVSMGGTRDDGRSIWFQLVSLGRFEGHALDAMASPSGVPPCLTAYAVPGGYAEAMGGTIYELGRPRVIQVRLFPNENCHALQEASSRNKTAGSSTFQQITTALLSVFAVLSLMTMSFGYAAGSSFSHGYKGSFEVPPTAHAMTMPEIYMGAPVQPNTATLSNFYQKSTARTSPSVSEMRARQALRVLQEKRLMHDIGSQLRIDEMRLGELRQLERFHNRE